MLLYSASRNIFRSSKRSIIIVILQTVIITLFFLGNAVLIQSNHGLKESFIDNFTGDAMVKVPSELPVSIFGAITPAIEEFYTVAELPVYDSVMDRLLSMNQIADVTPILSGRAYMNLSGYGAPVPIFGITGAEYFDFFPTLKISPVSTYTDIGVFVTRSRADKIEIALGRALEIGEPFQFTSYEDGIFRIREVPFSGVLNYENAGSVLNEVVLVDAQTLRELNQVSLAFDLDYQPEDNSITLMDHDLNTLFADPADVSGESNTEDGGLSLEILMNIMSQETTGELTELSGGGWHFILLRFTEGMNPHRTLRKINQSMRAFNLEVVDWRTAAGFSAFLILLLQILFNGGFILVVTAGVIAVVNILVISIIERTGEIGTLRAIGASRSYVRRLLATETLILSLLSGILAVMTAIAAITYLNSRHLELSNSLLSSLFGSGILTVQYSPLIVAMSLLLSVVLGLVASWFPIILALRVQPVRAISQES